MNFKDYVRYTNITEGLPKSQELEILNLFKMMNEGLSLKDMKSNIKDVLSKITDYAVISKVFFVLNEKKFETMLNQYLVDSNLTKSPSLFDSVMHVLSNSKFEEADLFINDLVNDKILPKSSTLLKPGKHNILSLTNPKDQTILSKMFPKLMAAELSNTKVGPGEVLLAFISKDIQKANVGDLIIDGKEAEVKSTQARMESAKYAYGDAPKILMKLRTDMEMLGYVVKTKTGFSFSLQELKQINSFIKTNPDNKTKVEKLLENALEAIMKNGYGKKLWKIVYNGSEIDTKSYAIKTQAMFFEMYKGVDKWDGILFINRKNYECLFIRSGKDLISHASDFSYTYGPAYDTMRSNGVPQISLR